MPDNRIMLDIDGLEKLLAKRAQASQNARASQSARGALSPQNTQNAQGALSPKEQEKLQNIIESLRAHKAQIDSAYKYAACAYAAYAGLDDYMSGRFSRFGTIDSVQKSANATPNTALDAILTPAQLESFERLTPAQKALFAALIRRPNMKGDKIIIGGFSPRLWSEALAVARDFEVVKHINERCAESRGGFKATLFKDNSQSAPNAQSYVLALAGTDAPSPNIFNDEIDIKDLCADVSLALKRLPHAQFESMINFYYRIKSEIFAGVKVDSWDLDSGSTQKGENLGMRNLDSSVAQKGENPSAQDLDSGAPINPATSLTAINLTPISLTIVGHSLGGYLAQIFALVFAEDISGVYTYQAPGAGDFYREFLGVKTWRRYASGGAIERHLYQAYENLSFARKRAAEAKVRGKVFHLNTASSAHHWRNSFIFGNFIEEFGRKIQGARFYANVGSSGNRHHPSYPLLALQRLENALRDLESKNIL